MSSAQYPIDDSEFEAGATDLSDLLELVEQKEAEEFGAEIDRNESEESRMIRQIALREIFVFLTDKSDQHVANLRVSKRGDHLKLNVNFERKQTNVERVTLLQDPHAKERLNIYPFPDALAGGSRTSLKRSLTPNPSTDVSETETAQPIPKNFVVNLCDRLVGLVMKHDPRKEVQK
ncbi:hypothetical protein L596_008488 [Steinernema carpocapsae]|uniref:Uncharacterized protein n=1 Tax=Steinernema carpocapsae TaxID=34508 RepID=A0A4U5PDP8_STECR|nr:hypothetical protein L596_008488 [Steinernema carpocapsae]